MGKRQSEVRNIKRHGVKGSEVKEYLDNRGEVYDYKWVARIASFYNFIVGGLWSGFPVFVKYLMYPAWAFYPFFFIKGNLQVKDPVPVLNHERIHIHQQRELIMLFFIPLLLLGIFHNWQWLIFIPFVPTFFYTLNFLWVLFTITGIKNSLGDVRRRTCFEIEAERFASDRDYLLHRKAFHEFKFINYKKYFKE